MQLLFYSQLFGEIVAVCCGNFWKHLSQDFVEGHDLIGHTVAQFLEALRHTPECSGLHSRRRNLHYPSAALLSWGRLKP